MTAVPPAGGHRLAQTFSGTGDAAPPPRRHRRPGRALLIGVLGGLAVVAALTTAQVSAHLGYDAAAIDYREVSAMAETSKTDLRTQSADLTTGTEAAQLILAAENEAIAADAAAEDALASAASQAEEVAVTATELLEAEVPGVAEKPVWFWDVLEVTAELDARSERVSALADDLVLHSTEVSDAATAVTTSGLALLVSTGEAATAFEARHPSARNDAVIALREAATDAIAADAIDETAVAAYTALQEAAAQVVATEEAELAEKSGPLRDARLEIEAFARSLAPGVLLEFDWAPIVNGAGADGSMGGYTTWWWDDPGRAVIELSDSVAEQWPAERSRALVAHEVGHAISVKCQDMYDSSTQDSIEKWATAWAISMGFTDEANGVWAYGYPPQNYIDAAAGCR